MAPARSFDCPVCGEEVPAKAKACPHCGACEKSGWNEELSAADGLDLPEDNFDYEKFTAKEFDRPRKRRGKDVFVWITGLILLIMVTAMTLFNFLFR